MGQLQSTIQKISAVSFLPFPKKRTFRNAKVVHSARGVYLLAENGNVFTTGEMSGKFFLCGTGSEHHAVKALVDLGVITAAEAREHGKRAREHDKNLNEYRAAFNAVDDFAKAGIAITKRQRETVAMMKKRISVKELPYYVQGEAAKKLGLKE